MNTLNFFKTHAELWSTVKWENDKGFVFYDRDAADRRQGVYAFVSKYGIEKVGKIENAHGVKARTYQYQHAYRRLETGINDRSDVLWEAMCAEPTAPLYDTQMDFYFFPCDAQNIDIHGITVETSYIRNLEKTLSEMARKENHPMRLAGKGN